MKVEQDMAMPVGDHELERQSQHRHGVVHVQPASLPFAGAKGEEVLEDPSGVITPLTSATNMASK